MKTSLLLINVVFYAIALLAAGSALAVALSRNIVRSAFSLLAALFAAAGLYALMKADFIFAIQVLVYVGGILVLIIFAVMLTQRIVDVNVSNPSVPGWLAGVAVLGLLLCLMFGLFAYQSRLPEAVKPAQLPNAPEKVEGMTEAVGRQLMGEYLYPFEIISVLLLACLIGAAYLARKEVKSP